MHSDHIVLFHIGKNTIPLTVKQEPAEDDLKIVDALIGNFRGIKQGVVICGIIPVGYRKSSRQGLNYQFILQKTPFYFYHQVIVKLVTPPFVQKSSEILHIEIRAAGKGLILYMGSDSSFASVGRHVQIHDIIRQCPAGSL